MSKKTTIKVNFRIIGDDFTPSEVSQKLSIIPSVTWKNGDEIKTRSIKRTYSCWEKSFESESIDAGEQILKIINELESKKNELIQLKKDNDYDYKFDIVINIFNNEKPSIFLDKKILNFINEIDAEIDFDMYIY